MSTPLDQEQALIAANEELIAAHAALDDAVKRIRKAALAHYKANLALMDPARRGPYLARAAFENRATWSGGATSTTNISEAAARSAALELLQSEVR